MVSSGVLDDGGGGGGMSVMVSSGVLNDYLIIFILWFIMHYRFILGVIQLSRTESTQVNNNTNCPKTIPYNFLLLFKITLSRNGNYAIYQSFN